MRFTSYFILLHRLAALTYSTPISDTADIETSPTLPKRTSGSPAHSPPTIPVYVPPSYIWEPNNATCRAMLTYSVGEMFESTFFMLETKGDWVGHDWGRGFLSYLKSWEGCDVHIWDWKFEYYNATGDWHNRKSRNYQEPGSGPAWNTFTIRSWNPSYRQCVERSIREFSDQSGAIDVKCTLEDRHWDTGCVPDKDGC